MKFNRIASGCLIATLAAVPAQQAAADGDALVGGIIGGIIGGAIVNEASRNRKATTTHRSTATARTSVSSAQREANREVQVALNYFGYPVGTPDGAIGPKSRAAISQYQVLLGYPATGQLTEYERTVLVTSYHRAVAGGPLVAQSVSTHPMGLRGLLLMQRDEMAGIVPQPGAAPGIMATAPQIVPEPAPALPVLATAPEPAAPEAAAPGLPSFMGTGMAQVSLASHCNKVSLLTNTNGGYTSAAAMTDANFALGEQFCLARTYAMASGEELAASVPGFTPQQIAEQCHAFGPVLKDHVAALSLKPRDEVLAGVSGFVLSSGMAPAQLAGTAKICLGVGYTTDAMDVAIGSALLLVALGEKGYAELPGHHLSQGFGAAARPDLALGWYEQGLEANQAGHTVFAPGLPDRMDLIRKAAYTINGRSDLIETAPALPVFAVAPAAPEAAVAAPAAPEPAPVVAVTPAEPEAINVAAPQGGAGGLNGGSVVSLVGRLLGN
ncbi:MAG TPA: peptidoglycan-binding domain-containing protein [Paracoccaceae bacterium]